MQEDEFREAAALFALLGLLTQSGDSYIEEDEDSPTPEQQRVQMQKELAQLAWGYADALSAERRK